MVAHELEHSLKYSSWHMWLANFGLDKWHKLDAGDRVDICSYIRMMLSGLLKLTAVVFFGSLAVSWVLFSIGNVFGWLLLGYQLEFATFLFWMLLGVLACLVGIVAGKEKVQEYIAEKRHKARVEQKPPGFLRLAYRKFKEKTCFVLEVK